MRDFYKKLMRMSVKDAQSICRETGSKAQDEMALQLFTVRVRHWHMKAIDERQWGLPDDPQSMYE